MSTVYVTVCILLWKINVIQSCDVIEGREISRSAAHCGSLISNWVKSRQLRLFVVPTPALAGIAGYRIGYAESQEARSCNRRQRRASSSPQIPAITAAGSAGPCSQRSLPASLASVTRQRAGKQRTEKQRNLRWLQLPAKPRSPELAPTPWWSPPRPVERRAWRF